MPATLTNEEFAAFYDSRPGWVVLTSITPEGYPHSVPLGYFRDGDRIFCGVRDNTTKIKNIETNPKVSLLIESGSTMADIKGAMVQGEAKVIRDAEGVLQCMRMGASKRGVPEEELPKETRPGSAFIEVSIQHRISWDYGKTE